MVRTQKLEWNSRKEIWIAAGGTAGHLLPALGVAESLVRNGVSRDSIGFITSSRPIERQVVAPYGFELWQMDTKGLVRRVAFANIVALLKMVLAIAELFRFGRRNKPQVVLGFGGYFSIPPMLVARLMRIPLIVVETNAVAGLANRVISKVATISLASAPSSGISNAELVDVPLRPEITSTNLVRGNVAGFKAIQGLESNEFLVCVFGGSLGSLRINETVVELVGELRRRRDIEIAIYHVIGSRDFPSLGERAKELARAQSSVKYIFCEFDSEIYKALSECDLVVSRAGSGTISELAYLGKPSILIPLPNAPGDHQRINAMALVENGAARVISDQDLSCDLLANEILELYCDREMIQFMSDRAKECFRGDGSDRISEYVLDLMIKEGKQ